MSTKIKFHPIQSVIVSREQFQLDYLTSFNKFQWIQSDRHDTKDMHIHVSKHNTEWTFCFQQVTVSCYLIIVVHFKNMNEKVIDLKGKKTKSVKRYSRNKQMRNSMWTFYPRENTLLPRTAIRERMFMDSVGKWCIIEWNNLLPIFLFYLYSNHLIAIWCLYELLLIESEESTHSECVEIQSNYQNA